MFNTKKGFIKKNRKSANEYLTQTDKDSCFFLMHIYGTIKNKNKRKGHWMQRILIVEDEEYIANLMSAFD